jgi:hypothetical protein
MIVGGGIDEVAQDFFLRPLIGAGAAAGGFFRDGEQARARAGDDLIEIGGEVGGGHEDDRSIGGERGWVAYG